MSEVRFWRVVNAARLYARKATRLQITPDSHWRTRWYDWSLGQNEHQHSITVLVVGQSAVVVACSGGNCVLMVVIEAASVVLPTTKLDIAGKRVCEMRLMMSMLDPVHHRYIGLARQHERERHAEHRDCTLQIAGLQPHNCPLSASVPEVSDSSMRQHFAEIRRRSTHIQDFWSGICVQKSGALASGIGYSESGSAQDVEFPVQAE